MQLFLIIGDFNYSLYIYFLSTFLNVNICKLILWGKIKMDNRECVEKLIKQGFKAKVIAEYLNVSASYISKYRKCERELSKLNQIKLTQFLNKYKNIL